MTNKNNKTTQTKQPQQFDVWMVNGSLYTSQSSAEISAGVVATMCNRPVEIRKATVSTAKSVHVTDWLPSQELTPNPLAESILDLSYSILREIEGTTDDGKGIMLDVNGPRGIPSRSMRDSSGERVSTNDECATMSLNFWGGEKSFDLRKPLPRPVAAWMRRMASKLMTAADMVEQIEDNRDLRQIRKMVAQAAVQVEGGEA